jgi:ABC-2 type transport system permease protein
MITLVRVELLKLRTTRTAAGLLAAAIGISLLWSTLEASRAGKPSSGVASLSTSAGLTAIVTGGVWSLLFGAVLGVMVTSGEFRHSTVTSTYLATPLRSRVLAAKAIASAIAGGVFGFAGWLVATAVGYGFALSQSDHATISVATNARYAIGHILAGALLGAAGAGLGALIRSQVAGIITVFVWGIIIESLIGGLFTSVRPYLPYTAATTLGGTALGQASFSVARGAAAGAALPFAGAAALVAAVGLVLLIAAARTTVRRDVT